VWGDLAPDLGVLEDDHALQEQRVGHADSSSSVGERRRTTEGVERRVEIVHGVPGLVQALMLVDQKIAVIGQHAVLEEEAGLVSRSQEVVIAPVALVSSGEHGADAVGIELVDELTNSGAKTVEGIRSYSIGKDGDTVRAEVVWSEHLGVALAERLAQGSRHA